jgi:glycosyltransferase involved in cell wall biosynthesis
VPRVVVVHDYLTQRGGAERVALALARAFDDAPVVTSVYARERTFPEFGELDVRPILRVPVADPRRLFPVLPLLFGRHRVRDADVVVCSSSGWAHGVATAAPKVVYCHTPPRWLHVPGDYLLGQPWPVRAALRAAQTPLRRWDARAAASAARYVANSTTVRERIRRAYGLDAEVVHPPPGLDADGAQEPVDVGDEPFLLAVARARAYKNAGLVEEAAARAGVRVVVVGSSARTTSDAELRWLYANCRGLVAAAFEDFGLTPVEAMSFGKPVLALRAGGYLDSVVEGVTGAFFDRADVATLAAALARFDERDFDPAAIRGHAEAFAPERFVARMRELVAGLA